MMLETPLVSFMVIAYRQERFIRQVVRSVLGQTYEPLEIVFSDDCSPDKTFDIIREEATSYRGPHKLVLNRNPVNLGVSGNVNKVWELSRGELLIAGAGDDVAYPHRTQALTAKWLEGGKQADIVTCSHFDVLDVDGRLTATNTTQIAFPDLREPSTRWRCGVTGACAAYSRRVYAGTGPLDQRIIAEDNVYPFWVWLRGGVVGIVPGALLGKIASEHNLASVFNTIRFVKSRAERRRLRMRAADDILARSLEWLRLARNEKHARGVEVARQLERLVRLRTNQRECFDAPVARVVRLAGDTMMSGMGIRHTAGVILRGFGLY